MGLMFLAIGFRIIRNNMGKRELSSEIYQLTKEPLDKIALTGVYGIKSKLNNKYYVGSTSVISGCVIKGFLKRWICHFHELENNKHHSTKLQNHVNKYGIYDIEFVILEVLEDITMCRQREKFWIDLLDSYYNGFNSSLEADSSIGGETHPRYKKIDNELVVKLYVEEKITIKNIASTFNVSVFKIKTILK
jgi:group I intron endonuclease